jgi:hypothetical protein
MAADIANQLQAVKLKFVLLHSYPVWVLTAISDGSPATASKQDYKRPPKDLRPQTEVSRVRSAPSSV